MKMSTAGRAYTPDDQYAAFSGRVVKTYVKPLGVTLDGYVIGRVTRVIDVGRADTVKPFDVVDALEPVLVEHLQPKYNMGDAQRVQAELRAKRRAELQERVTAYLLQYGPSHVPVMCADLDIPKSTLKRFVRELENSVLCRVGNSGQSILWGLIGVHDKATR